MRQGLSYDPHDMESWQYSHEGYGLIFISWQRFCNTRRHSRQSRTPFKTRLVICYPQAYPASRALVGAWKKMGERAKRRLWRRGLCRNMFRWPTSYSPVQQSEARSQLRGSMLENGDWSFRKPHHYFKHLLVYFGIKVKSCLWQASNWCKCNHSLRVTSACYAHRSLEFPWHSTPWYRHLTIRWKDWWKVRELGYNNRRWIRLLSISWIKWPHCVIDSSNRVLSEAEQSGSPNIVANMYRATISLSLSEQNIGEKQCGV